MIVRSLPRSLWQVRTKRKKLDGPRASHYLRAWRRLERIQNVFTQQCSRCTPRQGSCGLGCGGKARIEHV
jgi:hypothetical protein